MENNKESALNIDLYIQKAMSRKQKHSSSNAPSSERVKISEESNIIPNNNDNANDNININASEILLNSEIEDIKKAINKRSEVLEQEKPNLESNIHEEFDVNLISASSSPENNRELREMLSDLQGITMQNIEGIARIQSPSQATVNIVIAFVSFLQKGCKEIQDISKTYENCVELLKQSNRVFEITRNLIENTEWINKDIIRKILKIKDKYLVGADMNPNATSEKCKNTKAMLSFLLKIIDYSLVFFVMKHN